MMRKQTDRKNNPKINMKPVEMLISKYHFSENLRSTWMTDRPAVIRMVAYSLPEEGQHEFWTLYDGD